MNDLVHVCSGKRFKVMMTPNVAKQFEKADPKERARCRKWMDFYADDGGEFLDKEKLRFEGFFSTKQKAGTKVGILAFKAWQLRVYGGVVKGNVFVATEIDTSKKQNAADRSTLVSAAMKLANYI